VGTKSVVSGVVQQVTLAVDSELLIESTNAAGPLDVPRLLQGAARFCRGRLHHDSLEAVLQAVRAVMAARDSLGPLPRN
jgi:hypothetical protein